MEKNNMENIDINRINNLLDELISILKKLTVSHPYFVVIIMHEYFRNIWPNDPFIEETLSKNKSENIELCLINLIQISKNIKFIGSYFNNFNNVSKFYENLEKDNENEDNLTQTVYGKLWKNLEDDYISGESKNVLINLLQSGGYDVNEFKNKKILDMGCGSGRFSIAFAQLNVKEVVGIDLGKTGIGVGTKIIEKFKLNNIKLIEGNVLSLPFKDNEFDFIFSKGVLHHTGNLKKGLDEYFRVLKKGGTGFLYLYGSGGLFWNSRKKMREVMKLIPMNYTIQILKSIGMPNKRYVFADSWYVPIEEHVKRDWLENYFNHLKYSKIKKIDITGDDTIESMSEQPFSKELWGDGELRYFLTK